LTINKTSFKILLQLFEPFLRGPLWSEGFLDVGNELTKNHLDENVCVDIDKVKKLRENCHDQSWQIEIDTIERE
jgi:hypothetical protein